MFASRDRVQNWIFSGSPRESKNLKRGGIPIFASRTCASPESVQLGLWIWEILSIRLANERIINALQVDLAHLGIILKRKTIILSFSRAQTGASQPQLHSFQHLHYFLVIKLWISVPHFILFGNSGMGYSPPLSCAKIIEIMRGGVMTMIDTCSRNFKLCYTWKIVDVMNMCGWICDGCEEFEKKNWCWTILKTLMLRT